jgi:hypothetical protein
MGPRVVTAEKDEGLKRLGGGRWQTRDERFTIEPQSGTWAVLDAEQTDDLGLPLVRGPFKSLGAAKAAIVEARSGAAPASTLKASAATREASTKQKAQKARDTAPPKPEEPEEPRWLRDLEPDARRRATRLIDRLTRAEAADPEGLVRRDIVGEVPAIAAFAIERAIRALGEDVSMVDIVELLTDGRDADLGVRWRLVDDEGRHISVDTRSLEPG